MLLEGWQDQAGAKRREKLAEKLSLVQVAEELGRGRGRTAALALRAGGAEARGMRVNVAGTEASEPTKRRLPREEGEKQKG